jgi:hypothetical protein
MTALDLFREALLQRQASWPRSSQTASGASDAYGCRAATLLRLTGVPKSDPQNDIGLAPTWGTGIHSVIEYGLTGRDDVKVEQRLAYRDVPVTVDVLHLSEKAVRDWKGIELGALSTLKRENRPKSESHRAQVHIGAAAAIEAGHDITTVSILYIPRDGRGVDDCWEWSEPFSLEIADAAVDWLQEQDTVAAQIDVDDLLYGGVLETLRDEPPGFCATYCAWFTACRGQGQPDTASEPATLDAAQRYAVARIDAAEAEARKKYYRDLLRGAPPVVTDGWRVAWTRDSLVYDEEPDPSQVDVGAYEAIIGPLPRKAVAHGKASELRVTKVRAK